MDKRGMNKRKRNSERVRKRDKEGRKIKGVEKRGNEEIKKWYVGVRKRVERGRTNGGMKKKKK